METGNKVVVKTLIGKHCRVEVCRRAMLWSDNAYKYIWTLYVYIEEDHPLYSVLLSADTEEYPAFSDKLYSLDLHCGCTFYEKLEDGVLKIGCDYCHLNDETYMLQADLPEYISRDASDLLLRVEEISTLEY